jgi:hypothetical protein
MCLSCTPPPILQLRLRRSAHLNPQRPVLLMEVKRKDVWGLLVVLLLGQLVAFTLAASSFSSSLIANLGTRFPQLSHSIDPV